MPVQYHNIEAAIRAAVPAGVVVRSVRFRTAAEASGPSVLWRVLGRAEMSTLDAASGPPTVEIECRAPSPDDARLLAEDVLDGLRRAGALNRILDQRDEADDPSAQRGDYFAHTLVVDLGQ